MQIDEKIRSYGKENKVPITLDDTLSFLIQTINENNSKEILEIGTAIGFGCVTIAENTNCSHIDTLEIDEERFKIFKRSHISYQIRKFNSVEAIANSLNEEEIDNSNLFDKLYVLQNMNFNDISLVNKYFVEDAISAYVVKPKNNGN